MYAACLRGQVRLSSWVPAQGYLIDGYSRGPAASAWVKFKSSGTELTVTVTCAGGQPRFTTATDTRGGGEGGGHGGGSGMAAGAGPAEAAAQPGGSQNASSRCSGPGVKYLPCHVSSFTSPAQAGAAPAAAAVVADCPCSACRWW